MAAGAGVALENNVGTFVDSNAVVLVVNSAVLDREVVGRDIKAITTKYVLIPDAFTRDR
jgi:hypothetical protein